MLIQPIPTGDGQKLALRLQASRFFQTYSFSISLNHGWVEKNQYNFLHLYHIHNNFLFNPQTRRADKDRRFNITGITCWFS